MIAEYNDKYYAYIADAGTSRIMTEQKDKTDDGFIADNGIFFKDISYEDLTSVFNITFLVTYDTGFPSVSNKWNVEEILNNRLPLRFSGGILPGWQAEGSDSCVKYIGLDEVSFAREIFVFTRKNYITLEQPLRVENIIDVNSLVSRFHKSKNL
jgi:hypothetical protein